MAGIAMGDIAWPAASVCRLNVPELAVMSLESSPASGTDPPCPDDRLQRSGRRHGTRVRILVGDFRLWPILLKKAAVATQRHQHGPKSRRRAVATIRSAAAARISIAPATRSNGSSTASTMSSSCNALRQTCRQLPCLCSTCANQAVAATWLTQNRSRNVAGREYPPSRRTWRDLHAQR